MTSKSKPYKTNTGHHNITSQQPNSKITWKIECLKTILMALVILIGQALGRLICLELVSLNRNWINRLIKVVFSLCPWGKRRMIECPGKWKYGCWSSPELRKASCGVWVRGNAKSSRWGNSCWRRSRMSFRGGRIQRWLISASILVREIKPGSRSSGSQVQELELNSPKTARDTVRKVEMKIWGCRGVLLRIVVTGLNGPHSKRCPICRCARNRSAPSPEVQGQNTKKQLAPSAGDHRALEIKERRLRDYRQNTTTNRIESQHLVVRDHIRKSAKILTPLQASNHIKTACTSTPEAKPSWPLHPLRTGQHLNSPHHCNQLQQQAYGQSSDLQTPTNTTSSKKQSNTIANCTTSQIAATSAP